MAYHTAKRNETRTLDLATPPPSALLTPISTTNVGTTSILTPTPTSELQADRSSIPSKNNPALVAKATTGPSSPSIGSANFNISIKDDKAPQKWLEFIFQKKPGATNLDWDSNTLFNTDTSQGVEAFFQACSIRWRLLPEYLTCLEFTLDFDDEFEPITIKKGDEQAWERFKRETKRKFQKVIRQQPEKEDFLVWVEMELSQIKECAGS